MWSILFLFIKYNKVFVFEVIVFDFNDNILIVDSMRNCLLVFLGEDGYFIVECVWESFCNLYGVVLDRVGRVIIFDFLN